MFFLGISFQDPEKQAILVSQINLPDLAVRAQRLQQLLIDTEATLKDEASSISMFGRGKLFGLEIVFTHNDLLAGNVLIPLDFYENLESRKGMKFIDYEYAGYNPRAFDIANHFCGQLLHCRWFNFTIFIQSLLGLILILKTISLITRLEWNLYLLICAASYLEAYLQRILLVI